MKMDQDCYCACRTYIHGASSSRRAVNRILLESRARFILTSFPLIPPGKTVPRETNGRRHGRVVKYIMTRDNLGESNALAEYHPSTRFYIFLYLMKYT